MIALAFLLAVDWVAGLGGRSAANAKGEVTALELRGAWVADSDLDEVGSLAVLEKLDLSLTRVTDLGLLRLRGLKNVREFKLFFAELVTDEGLAVVKSWPKIERLDFRGTKVTDNTLATLAGKDSIAALDIGYAEVTDSGLQHLTRFKGLRELSFGGNKMTEVGLEVLRSLPNLTKLDISGKQRTDSGLWFVGITDIGLDPVSTLRELRDLNLSGTQITSKGIARLEGLKKLERLNLFGVKRVNDDAMRALAALPALRWVDLKDTGVSSKGFEELKRLRPELKIGGDPALEKTQHYTLEYENDFVRAVRVRYGPKEKAPMHDHPETASVIYVYLTDSGEMRFVHGDGRNLVRAPVRAGALRIARGGKETHSAENLSDQLTDYVRVELVRDPKEPLKKDERFDPVTPSSADGYQKVVLENADMRVTRLTCLARAVCPVNQSPALDVDLGSGAVTWLAAGTAGRFNEATVGMDLVRVEVKRQGRQRE
ncbi:MAG: hypothetical protein U0Q16_04170 [Bryobacteraceae bacterium]